MRRLLRTAWDLPAAADAPAHVWRDGVLVGALLVLAVIETLVRPDLPWRWATLAVEVAVLPTLLWRRTRPGQMTALAFGTLFVFDTVRGFAGLRPTDTFVIAGLLILIYALTRWGSGRAIALGGAVVFATMIRAFAVEPAGLQNTIGGIAVVAVCGALGVLFRSTDAARSQRLERVRLQERARLARDLHDTVAHHVSAIAIRAQAGILTGAADPAAAGEALRVIEVEAAQTLGEMRAMVGMLREGGSAPRTPAPTLPDLPALVQGSPPVALEVRGDISAVPATVGAAAYRIAQEAVTNSRRHARGATMITVSVIVQPDRVGIRVTDDGHHAGGSGGQGFGLAGMRERAALLGGTCTAAGGASGWVVTADLPIGGAR